MDVKRLSKGLELVVSIDPKRQLVVGGESIGAALHELR